MRMLPSFRSKIRRILSLDKFAQSETRFRATFENAAVGIAHVAPDGSWLRVNRCFCQITGYTMEELLAKTCQEVTHPDDLEAGLAQLQRIIDGEVDDVGMEKRYLRKDGSNVWVKLTVGCVREADGAVSYLICVAENISERKKAEQFLRESEERFRTIVGTAADAIVVIDEAGLIESINPAGERMLGYASSELAGKNVSILMPEPHHSAHDGYLSAYMRTGRPRIIGRPRELEYRCKDGSIFIGELAVTECRSNGRRYFTGIIRDLSERKRHAEHVSLLLREVNHRSKNMLAVVQAIARQTASAKPEDFVERFGERIRALAASQDLLVRHEWKGVDLDSLVRSQLAHFNGLIGKRIDLRGPPVVISASAAQAIGMALHELATNAGKYGALSNASGCVEIAWSLEGRKPGDGTFVMSWREHGGPPVTVPVSQGFGSTVISRIVTESLNADVKLEFEVTGLLWRLECPAMEVAGDIA